MEESFHSGHRSDHCNAHQRGKAWILTPASFRTSVFLSPRPHAPTPPTPSGHAPHALWPRPQPSGHAPATEHPGGDALIPPRLPAILWQVSSTFKILYGFLLRGK